MSPSAHIRFFEEWYIGIMKCLRIQTIGLLLMLYAFIGISAYGQSTYRIGGRVLDMTNGPIGDAAVRMYSPETVWETKADENGFFSFAGLPPDTYDLQVQSPGFDTWTAKSPLKLVDRSVDDVTVTLNPGSCSQCEIFCDFGVALSTPAVSYSAQSDVAIRGAARECSGTPVSGIIVSIKSVSRSIQLLSDDQGEFQVGDLPPGKYTVTLSGPGFSGSPPTFWGPRSIDFWVARQNLTRLNLFLPRAPGRGR
jgi:Carboxypeptidase regulatory-like domain